MLFAIVKTSAAEYQRTIFTSCAPCRLARFSSKSASVPQAVLILYFFAKPYAVSVPLLISICALRLVEPSGKGMASLSSGNGLNRPGIFGGSNF